MLPTQAKAARPAQWIHPVKGILLPSSASSPRPPPSFVNHSALYAGQTGTRAKYWSRLLHYEACVHPYSHV